MKKGQGRTRNPGDTRRGSVGPREDSATESGLVSVVIPCYNQAHFLGEAVETITMMS